MPWIYHPSRPELGLRFVPHVECQNHDEARPSAERITGGVSSRASGDVRFASETAEMIPHYMHHPEVMIENTARAVRAIIGK